MYFGNRRPRGFHYTYRFSNEQRDILDNLRRGVPPDVLAERSLNEGEPMPRHRSRHGMSGIGVAIGLVVLVMLVLFVLFYFILSFPPCM